MMTSVLRDSLGCGPSNLDGPGPRAQRVTICEYHKMGAFWVAKPIFFSDILVTFSAHAKLNNFSDGQVAIVRR